MSEEHPNKSQPDYSKALKYYEDAKKLGRKGEADKVLAGLNAKYHNNVPPKEMERGLEALTKNSNSGVNYADIGAAVATIGLTVAAPALGIMAGTLYLISKYYSSNAHQTKPAH
ncbi:MAG: hypothetical protein AABX32_01675 [Nanoarchaeota archaeon]